MSAPTPIRSQPTGSGNIRTLTGRGDTSSCATAITGPAIRIAARKKEALVANVAVALRKLAMGEILF
ncbi:hypothetical protein SF83666_b50550 (plasmid) [Sinorhizobium fredii CCBAU 83666]|nr:hypothetical protein SF83666_b50550 [Sinorhizobium fredii CCBAU 83666]